MTDSDWVADVWAGNITPVTEWQPDPREVPAELAEDFPHATFPKPATHFPTIAEQLDSATHDQLLAMAKSIL